MEQDIYSAWAADRQARARTYYAALPAGVLTKPLDFYVRRTVTCGGSDIGAWCGLNAYSTPMEVFNAKTMRTPPFAGNFNTELGTALEPFIYNRLPKILPGSELIGGDTVIPAPAPWNAAQIDNVATVPQYGRVFIECKKATRGSEWGPGSSIVGGQILEEDDQIPDSYYAQVQFGMACAALACREDVPRVCLVLALFLTDREISVYVIHREPEVGAELLARSHALIFNHLIPDEPPAATDAENLAAWSKAKPTLKKIESAGARKIGEELVALKERIKELTGKKAELEDQLKLRIGAEYEAVTEGGDIIATWKASLTNRFNTVKFKGAHPDLYKQFSEPSSTRTFLLKVD